MDDAWNERAGLLGVRLRQLRQQVEERQAPGGELLSAIVLVILHSPVKTGGIHCREACQLKG